MLVDSRRSNPHSRSGRADSLRHLVQMPHIGRDLVQLLQRAAGNADVENRPLFAVFAREDFSEPLQEVQRFSVFRGDREAQSSLIAQQPRFDRIDHAAGRPVYNRITGLKDGWAPGR